MNTIFLMTVIDPISSRIKFLEGECFGKTYLFALFLSAGLSGIRLGKETARFIRDHNFTHSDRAIIRNIQRTYTYLFPTGSTRKYFMEVALPDNLPIALFIEAYLRMRYCPIRPLGNGMEEIILIVMRVFFVVCCLDKGRQIIYKTVNYIPCVVTQIFTLKIAPTGVYPVGSNGENFKFKN